MADLAEITIADVARAAGVSVSTVSRILNGKQDVAPATRERVQQVIEDLGYIPHAQAQNLRAGRTRNLALLFPLKYPHHLPYNALDMEFIIGAAAAAGEQAFFFNLVTTPINKRGLLSLYRSAQVDGLVLMQIHTHDWRVDVLRESGYPFVMIGHCDDNTGVSFIDLDFEAAVITAFEYLVRQGHRHIAFLGQPAEMRQQGYGPSVRTWAGYQQALSQFGLSPIFREAGFAGQDIAGAALELLHEQPKITAIVTAHGYAPLSLIPSLTRRGLHIPDDCSVIGITSQHVAELVSPALTHIDFPSHNMGYKAVELLIRTLEGKLPDPEQILIPPRLVTRSSTGPAK